jgi:chemotaxis protein methyltransferase CheR
MNIAAHIPDGDEIPFSDADFKSLAALAYANFGLNLADSKKPLVYSRLIKRLKARGISSFRDYLSLVEQPQEDKERHELISALTTNVTSFFREDHHFDTLRDSCLQKIIHNAKAGKRGRIWSAGCSSGQEPYSIAMQLLTTFPDAAAHDVKILATDIDPRIVQKAEAGTYPVDERKGIPEAMAKKWAKPSADGKSFSIAPDAKKLITFGELNLIKDWPFNGPFDVIFCRNVAIYFDQQTQQTLWKRFCDILAPGGHLFIGHSERVSGPASQTLAGVGITSYQKRENTLQNANDRSLK